MYRNLFICYEKEVRVCSFNRKKVTWKFKRFQLFFLTKWEEYVVILLLVKGFVGPSLLEVFPQQSRVQMKNAHTEISKKNTAVFLHVLNCKCYQLKHFIGWSLQICSVAARVLDFSESFVVLIVLHKQLRKWCTVNIYRKQICTSQKTE